MGRAIDEVARNVSKTDPCSSIRYRNKVINLECGYRDRNWVQVVWNEICNGAGMLYSDNIRKDHGSMCS